MPKAKYSFIVPVFNRPKEIEELLASFLDLKGSIPYELLIIEDGSSITCKHEVEKLKNKLPLRYFFKDNSGPGASRNFGMDQAHSDFFIILDSDVLIHPDYLLAVDRFLESQQVDCYGGPDGATESFNNLQKAINFSMTSFSTTGGVRGHKSAKKFQPRSFNMGLSRKAYEASGGFGKIHPGEDPDLVLRLWDLGFKTAYIDEALVYHKRRISWKLFYKQVFKFGLARPILNKWHPNHSRLIFWFPSIFVLGFIVALAMALLGYIQLIGFYLLYLIFVFLESMLATKSMKVAMMAISAVVVQFVGYGYGFLKSTLYLRLYPQIPIPQLFPNLFFK